MKTLADYVKDIADHNKEHPDHGHNCSCMDDIVREMKDDIRTVLPKYGTFGLERNAEEYKAERRLWWVLSLATK